VVKLQTLDGDNRVIEQSAFSELQLDAPVKAHVLAQMMSSTAGYKVEKSELQRSTPAKEGWSLRTPIAGFNPVSCYRRAMGGAAAGGQGHTMPYDAQRQPREVLLALGATYTLTRRLKDKDGEWWLTAVGEVPPQTLDAFAQSLVRAR
jgi:sigma-E factor negative regulatory protein RseB